MSRVALLPAVILANGASQRLGGDDKCPLTPSDATILDQVIAALRLQTSAILLNCDQPAAFAHTGLEVRPGTGPGQAAQLAGIRTAMLWAQERGVSAVLTVPADRPCLPPSLAARLAAANAGGHIAVAVSNGVLHPSIAVWPSALGGALQYEMRNGLCHVRALLERLPFKTVTFTATPHDPFMNINDPADLPRACGSAPLRRVPGERHGYHAANL